MRRLSGTLLGLCFSVAIMVGGIVTLTFAGEARLGAEVIGGCLLGVGISGNFTLYQSAICRKETPVDAKALIFGTAGGSVLYFVGSWVPSNIMAWAVVLAAAPAAGVVAVMCNRAADGVLHDSDSASASSGADAAEGRGEYGSASLGKGILSLLMPAIVLAAIGAILQALRLQGAFVSRFGALGDSPLNMGILFGAAAIFVLYARTGYRVNTDLYHRYFAPGIAIMLLLYPFAGDAYGAALVVCLYVMFNVASIDLILAVGQATRFYRIAPTALYALVFGIVYTARFLPMAATALLGALGLLPDLGGVLPIGDVFGAKATLALAACNLMFAVYVASVWYKKYQRKESVFSWSSALGPGGKPVGPETQDAFDLFASTHSLTRREAEVAQLLTEGRSVPYIANRIYLSESTVKYHCKNIYAKCGVHSRQELLDLYRNEGGASRQNEEFRP